MVDHNYFEEEDMAVVCDVWRMKDGVTKSFTKLFSLKTSNEIAYHTDILGFRKNGETIIERFYVDEDYDGQVASVFEVYDPSSRHMTNVIWDAENDSSVLLTSYIETILLLGESNSIIR